MSSRRKRDWDEPGSGGGDGERRREPRPDLGPLARMSGRALRRLIERVDMDTLSLALRYAEDSLVQRVLRNVSSRTAAALREEMEEGPAAGPDRPIRFHCSTCNRRRDRLVQIPHEPTEPLRGRIVRDDHDRGGAPVQGARELLLEHPLRLPGGRVLREGHRERDHVVRPPDRVPPQGDPEDEDPAKDEELVSLRYEVGDGPEDRVALLRRTTHGGRALATGR